MKKNFLCGIMLICLCVVTGPASAELWTANGSNIYYNSGNVGIGATAPGAILDVNGNLKIGSRMALTPSVFGYESSWKTLILGSTGTNYQTNAVTISLGYDPSGNPSGYYTGDGREVLVRNLTTFTQPTQNNNGFISTLTLSNGNVGIGTTTPSQKLHVKGGAALFHSSNSTDDNSGLRIVAPIFPTHYNWMIGAQQNVGGAIEFTPSTTVGGTTFSTPVMTIFQSGNVGIGTTYKYKTLTIGSNDATAFITPGGQNTHLSLQTVGASGAIRFFTIGGSAGNVAPTESMRIGPDGNVGIGTSTPQSALAVNGTITAKEVKVTQTGWADYVFKNDYKLRTLDTVESFIKEHKHLPDMPSAKEVEKNGIPVADMLVKQMQKIEELTLYMIELKKENTVLKNKIQEISRHIHTN